MLHPSQSLNARFSEAGKVLKQFAHLQPPAPGGRTGLCTLGERRLTALLLSIMFTKVEEGLCVTYSRVLMGVC